MLDEGISILESTHRHRSNILEAFIGKISLSSTATINALPCTRINAGYLDDRFNSFIRSVVNVHKAHFILIMHKI